MTSLNLTSAALWMHQTRQVPLWIKDYFTRTLYSLSDQCIFSLKPAEYVSFLPSSDGHPAVPPELTKSLKKISGKINTVLSVLGSMSQHQNITPPYSGFPQNQAQSKPTLNTSTSFPGMPQVHPDHSSSAFLPSSRLSESWDRAPQGSVAVGPLFSTPISSVLKAGK